MPSNRKTTQTDETTEPEIDVTKLQTVIDLEVNDGRTDVSLTLKRPGHLARDGVARLVAAETQRLSNPDVQVDLDVASGVVVADHFDDDGHVTDRREVGAFTWSYRP